MDNGSEIKDRLYILSKELGLNASQFSERVGKDRTYLSNIRKEIQTDVLRNIFIEFPDVNISWIVTGEGEMFNKTSSIDKSDSQKELIDLKCKIRELEKKNESLIETIGYWKAKAGVDLKDKPA